MAKCRFIFFDVGNTLLFPNRSRMLAPLPLPVELHPTLATWQALERRTKQEFDQGMIGGTVDHGFWWTFHTHLLRDLNLLDHGVPDNAVRDAFAVEAARGIDVVIDYLWGRPTELLLEALAKGFRATATGSTRLVEVGGKRRQDNQPSRGHPAEHRPEADG